MASALISQSEYCVILALQTVLCLEDLDKVDTVHPNYLQILYLWIHDSLKFIFNTEISTWDPFTVIYGHVHAPRVREFELPYTHVPSWGQTRRHCLLVSPLLLYTSVLSLVYLVKHFSLKDFIFWWFYCLKWLRCCLTLWLPYGEHDLRSGMSYMVLLTVSSALSNEKYVSNSMSLSRNPHRKRSCLDQSARVLWPEAYRTLTPCFF